MSERPATYSEAQLRAAIATSKSWRGVLRELGLRGTSSQSAQTRASRWGIDASHFTGSQNWSSETLASAVATSTTWVEVADKVGTTPSLAKRYALRAHLDVSAVGRRTDAQGAPGGLQHQSVAWRLAAEHWAAAWFFSVGGTAAIVHGQAPYDLLASIPGQVHPVRVQVKTSGFRTARGGWHFRLSERDAASGAAHMPYSPDDVDLFFLIASSGEAWLIPVAQVLGNQVCEPGREYLCFKVNDGPVWNWPSR